MGSTQAPRRRAFPLRQAAAAALLASSFGAASAEAPAQGDAAAPPSGDAPAAAPQRQVEEIIVTAQKTRQSLQEVPISISAVTGSTMRELGANNIQAIAAYTPNVKFSSDTDPALAQVSIRGFGSSPLNSSFESSVGFVEDDLFFGRPTYFTEAIFDIARVEVLRGPQGTLFGKNTSAGLFNVISNSPTAQFSANLRVSDAPEDGERRIEGGAGGMLTDWGGIRVSGLKIDRRGVLENTDLGRKDDQQQQEAGRVKLLFLPFEGLSMELTAVHSQSMMTYWPLQLDKLSPATLTYLRAFDPQVEDDPYNHQLSENTPGYVGKGSNTVGLKSEWELGNVLGIDDFKLTWINGYSHIYIASTVDLDQSPADIARLDVNSQHLQWSSEPRVSGISRTGLFGLGQSLEFVLGAFLYHANFMQATKAAVGQDFGSYLLTDSAQRQILGNTPLNGLLPLSGLGAANQLFDTLTGGIIGEDSFSLFFRQRTDTKAAFGQLMWDLNDQWTVTPGLRYSIETKDVIASGAPTCRLPPACIMEVALSAQAYDESSRHTEYDLSPKLAIQYEPVTDINLFASYAMGHKSGGVNAASFSGTNLDYLPENVTSVETGVKSILLDRTLTLNATLFHSRFANLQVVNIQGANVTVTNAATATAKGLEADLHWLTPLPFLSVTGSLGWLDARYDQYKSAPPTIDMAKGSSQDLSGRPLTFAPKVTASLSPTVQFPLGYGFGGQLTVDVLHETGQYTNLDLDQNTYVPAHTTYSARLILGHEHSAWKLLIGGSNLSNVNYANQIVNAAFFPGSYAVTQAAGRSLFGALTASW
jgi:iron complex outermembrane receptor protein